MPHTIRGESGDFAVITLQSVKVGIGCPNHVLAGPALIGRKVAHKGRPKSRQKRDCRFVNIAVEQLLDFLDLSAIDLQSHCDQRVAAPRLKTACGEPLYIPLQLDGSNTQLLTNQPADKLIERFACGGKHEIRTRPVQLKTCRLRRYPDLARRSLRADHNFPWARIFDFDRKHVVLEKDFNVVLFRNRTKRAV